MVRRNFFSINALWKNKVAWCLSATIFYPKDCCFLWKVGIYKILEITSRAVREMSEGELLQMEGTQAGYLRDVYFEIIRAKTASLLSAACAAGTISATNNLGNAQEFRQFGGKSRHRFQIKD
jgi:octaprenyl-diphosphate synthase